MEWHLPFERPSDTDGITGIIFCDNTQYYIGRSSADGKWYDNSSDEGIEAINAWAFLPDNPINGTADAVNQDWKTGNGPMPLTFHHFLLYDAGEASYQNINSPYFDSKNRTFKEISHYITLPNLPWRLSRKPAIDASKNTVLMSLRKKLGLENLVLDPFNDLCLHVAIRELCNTTTDGMRRAHLLEGEALVHEVANRWAFQLNNSLNKAENKPFADDPFGLQEAPETDAARRAARETLDLVTKALGV
jgi:hypothetical protein